MSWPLALAGLLARINRVCALVAGGVLLATVALILAEIVLRRIPAVSMTGADEVSGYVMAAVATWGFSYALTERAHVRIDVLQTRLGAAWRACLDLLAIASIAAVAALVTWHAWDVLATTLARDSRANTPLATPLWIPQSIWFAGWVWLSAVSLGLLVCVVALVAGRRWEEIDRLAGGRSDLGQES